MEEIIKRICLCCGEEKEITEFYKKAGRKYGRGSQCKICKKNKRNEYIKKNKNKVKQKRHKLYEENKEHHKEYTKKNHKKIKYKSKIFREENKERISARRRIYREKNKKTIKEQKKISYEKHKHKWREKSREYAKTHRKETNERHKKRISTDPLYKLSTNIRGLIRLAIKSKGYKKNTKTEQILGCSFEFFKQYLESQFNDWQNWNNWGIFKRGEIASPGKYWSIDHIIPLSSATTEGELIKLNHYTNLQVLDTYVNMFVKRDKMDFYN